MHKLIELIEKGKPFFEKISRNIYLRAIRDGFIAGMPCSRAGCGSSPSRGSAW